MIYIPTHPWSLLILVRKKKQLSASWFLIYKIGIMMWVFCTCLHYLVGKTFKAGARCALTFNCSLLFLPCPEQGITWSISPAQKGNKNCSLAKIFVFYCKVRHEGRERGNFLGLESSFALKYTFQLGVDADSSNTSASTANCYSLKATRGCCEQITKKNPPHKSMAGQAGLPPSHMDSYLSFLVLSFRG